MIMSAATTTIVIGKQHATGLLEGLRLRLWQGFYRFFEQLPEQHGDVDPEVLKRVPVPI